LTSKTPFLARCHTCNPSYSAGRDQDGSKPARANSLNSLQNPISKTLHKNRSGRVAQGEGPEFKPQYLKKKKKLCSFSVSFSQIFLEIFWDDFSIYHIR
jgi:hypothetical protein